MVCQPCRGPIPLCRGPITPCCGPSYRAQGQSTCYIQAQTTLVPSGTLCGNRPLTVATDPSCGSRFPHCVVGPTLWHHSLHHIHHDNTHHSRDKLVTKRQDHHPCQLFTQSCRGPSQHLITRALKIGPPQANSSPQDASRGVLRSQLLQPQGLQ